MSEPYRIPACPACSQPMPDQASRACELCKVSFCQVCADGDICASCLGKACDVVKRAAGRKKRVVYTPFPFTDRALRFFTLACGVASLGLMLLIGFVLRSITLQAVAATIKAAEQGGQEHLEQRRDERHENNDAAPQVQSPTPIPPPPPTGAVVFPAIPSVLTSLRPVTHDVKALAESGRALSVAGMDIMIIDVDLPRGFIEDQVFDMRTRVKPVFHDGQVAGLGVTGLRPGSLASQVGLQNGDILTSINGFAIASPDGALSAYQDAAREHQAIMEVIRDGRRILIHVRWAHSTSGRAQLAASRSFVSSSK
jgi:membrane-associated protease RseP (regulator of RpoE activity)